MNFRICYHRFILGSFESFLFFVASFYLVIAQTPERGNSKFGEDV